MCDIARHLHTRANFTARRYAMRGLSLRNSVCPSVRLSVTLVDCVHMIRPTVMISSPYGSPIIHHVQEIEYAISIGTKIDDLE